MRIKENLLIFKSIDYFWELEKEGKKPNTTRLISAIEYNSLRQAQIKKIRIENASYEDRRFFERDVISIIQLGRLLGYLLITVSWVHERDMELPEQ